MVCTPLSAVLTLYAQGLFQYPPLPILPATSRCLYGNRFRHYLGASRDYHVPARRESSMRGGQSLH
jgi:hypothetical protein